MYVHLNSTDLISNHRALADVPSIWARCLGGLGAGGAMVQGQPFALVSLMERQSRVE